MNQFTIISALVCFISFSISTASTLKTLDFAHGDTKQKFIPKPPSVQATSYIVLDANSGTVLAEKNSKAIHKPASLTKMMTLYVISDHITRGEIHLDDRVKVSTKAWKTKGSRTFVKAGQYVTVEDLLQGIIVQSGNDACIALVEHLSDTHNF